MKLLKVLGAMGMAAFAASSVNGETASLAHCPNPTATKVQDIAKQFQIATECPVPPLYHMTTAEMVDGEVKFASQEDFEEAMVAGFFRIKRPDDLDMSVGREFAKTFTADSRYNQFGALDVVNGYLTSEFAQTVRFTLERDNWGKCHIAGKEFGH